MKQQLENFLKDLTGLETIQLSTPPKKELGDFAWGAFQLSKVTKQNPHQIAQELIEKINQNKPNFIEKVEQAGPYINFFLSQDSYSQLFKNLCNQKITNEENKNRTIFVDYIGANVGKPLHIGHMCTPNLGQAIINVYRKLGYNVVSDSHIGDWGIIFGKLIVAYQNWGDEKKLKENAVDHLLELYIQATKKEEEDPSWKDKYQEAFKKLSHGDPEYIQLWALFTKESIKSMQKQLDKLNVKPDYNIGESFYEGLNLPKLEDYPDLIWSMKDIVNELIEKGIATKNPDGSVGVVFPDNKLPSTILQKRNGTHGYLASDLAAVKYRVYRWNPEKIIYFVDVRQSLHLQQVFEISKLAGRLSRGQMIKSEDNQKINQITEKIIGVAYKVHNELGNKLEEKVYQKAMKILLEKEGLKVETEVKVPSIVNNKEVGYGKIDLLVENKIVVELKSTKNTQSAFKQTRKYLSPKYPVGLILNFFNDKVNIARLEYNYNKNKKSSDHHQNKSSDILLIHAPNGFVKLKDGAMSTRKGKIIKLEALLDEAVNRAKKIILEKKLEKGEITQVEKELIEKNEIPENLENLNQQISSLAEIIGIGAIKYEYLRKNRELDIVFEWDQFMTFEGNSAPYIMYSYVRALSILQKANFKENDFNKVLEEIETYKNIFESNEEKELIKSLMEYKDILEETAEKNYPHILANYSYDLTKKFNSFYNKIPVLNEVDENKKRAKLALIQKTANIIKESFDLLGIKMPIKM